MAVGLTTISRAVTWFKFSILGFSSDLPGPSWHLRLNFTWASHYSVKYWTLSFSRTHTSSPDFHVSGNHVTAPSPLSSDCLLSPPFSTSRGWWRHQAFLSSSILRPSTSPNPVPPLFLGWLKEALTMDLLPLAPFNVLAIYQTTFLKYEPAHFTCLLETFPRLRDVLRIK